MNALKMFTFFVRNDTTKEIATFSGQGADLESAWKDAVKTIIEPWRPTSSGGANSYSNVVLPLNVRTPEGRNVARKKADFEGELPWAEGEETQ